jgi:hypothetical protein
VVGVTGWDRLAELSLVGVWSKCVEVDGRSAGLCKRKYGMNFLAFCCADLKKGFIVSCVETREPSTEFNAKGQGNTANVMAYRTRFTSRY